MTKKQVGEERVYLVYISTLLLSPKEVKTGTQAGQEAGADTEAMRDVTYWFALSHCVALGLLTVCDNVLVRVCIPAQNIMIKKQVGEERVYSDYTSSLLFITKGSQDRNSIRAGSRS